MSLHIILIVVISLLILEVFLSYFSKVSMETMAKFFFMKYEKSMYAVKKILLKNIIKEKLEKAKVTRDRKIAGVAEHINKMTEIFHSKPYEFRV